MDENDCNLLDLFDSDPERAAEQLRNVVLRLVRYFRWRRCRDPEDLAQETVVRGFASIAKGSIVPHPMRFFYGVARNIVYETRKQAARELPLNLDEVMSSLLPIDYRNLDAAVLLEEYLSHVSPDQAELLIRYHSEDRERLAAELGIDIRALRTRACRAKDNLEAWIRQHIAAGP